MTEISSQGYDSPIFVREDDYLNRWPFAKEIFSIAETAPSEWSVRIGIYGAWGTGKTSVLRFIENMARVKDHIVVNFNPWSYRTTSEMWEAFIPLVYQALKDAELEVEDYKATMVKSIGKKVANNIANAEEVIQNIADIFGWGVAAKITQSGLSTLTGFLQANSQQLQRISKVLGTRRIIVLIDDLDRTELRLLPEVLYALREVLDLPGFVFIMAFDPIVVGQALKEHHPGWGDGKRFLEKIIDFPRPLPPPTKRQLLNLVKSDVIRHSNFIDLDALENIFEFFPDNPRQLRSFIRSLWGIKSQVIRHNGTELSWHTLLLVQLLKFKQPDLAHALLQNEQMLKDWALSKLRPEEMEKVKQQFGELCTKVALNEQQEKQDCLSIMDAIVSKNLWAWDAFDINGLAHLSEEPPVLTFKELEAVLAVWISTQSVDKIQVWIADHANKIESTNDLAFTALFEKLVAYWDKQLAQAANAIRDEKRSHYIEQAENVVSLLKVLSFSLDGFVGSEPLLKINHFISVLQIANKWVHFDSTHDYQKQRSTERNFLEQIARETTLNSILLLEVLEPWNVYRGSNLNRNLSQNLFTALDSIVEPKAAKQVPEHFKTEDIFNNNSDVIAYLVLRQESTLWKFSNLKQAILQMAATADTSPIVQDNLLKLFELFAEKLKTECGQIVGISEYIYVPICPEFLHDIYIIEELWKGALSTALNPRIISTYADFRETIQKYINVQLTVPHFWSQWLSQVKS